MSIGSRRILLFLAGILFLYACVPERTVPSFTFPLHSIKLHYDPVSQELTAVDTLTIQYEKNVDRIYFFLHESLHVDRVGVGHQDFEISDMSSSDIEDHFGKMTGDWQQLVENAQIVEVHIPRSLYSERIEIRYKGTIDLAMESVSAWHPVLPDMRSEFHLTTILPRDYILVADGEVVQEEVDDLWRLTRMTIYDCHSCCQISVIQESI